MAGYSKDQEALAREFIANLKQSNKQKRQAKGDIIKDTDMDREFPYTNATELRDGYFYSDRISRGQRDLVVRLASWSPEEAPHVAAEMDLIHFVFDGGKSPLVSLPPK